MPQYRRQLDGQMVSEVTVRSGFDGSLPAELTEGLVNSLGYDFIKDAPKPEHAYGKILVEKIEQGANGKWYQRWECAPLEQNVESITNAGAKVSNLRGVIYTSALDGSRQTGLIAEDVNKVLPSAVIKNEDGTMSLDQLNIIGLLVEAIKELQEEVNALKAK